MVTLDKIRLTGLLTKSPAQSGLFHATATRLAVALPSQQPLGGLSEPLGPACAYRLYRQRPEPLSTVPAGPELLKRAGGIYRRWTPRAVAALAVAAPMAAR